MADLEKVILGLQAIYDEAYDRWVHTQYGGDKLVTLVSDVVPDALTLLRDQEPVKPIFDEEDVSGRCGVCGHVLTHQSMVGDVLVDEWFQYCPNCGKKVKWDA